MTAAFAGWHGAQAGHLHTVKGCSLVFQKFAYSAYRISWMFLCTITSLHWQDIPDDRCCGADSEAEEAASDAEPHNLDAASTAALLRHRPPVVATVQTAVQKAAEALALDSVQRGRRGNHDRRASLRASVRKMEEEETKLACPRKAFERLVKETFREQCEAVVRSGAMLPENMPTRVEKQGVLALQYALEHAYTLLSEDMLLLARHARRTTVCPADQKAVLVLRARCGDELAAAALTTLQGKEAPDDD